MSDQFEDATAPAVQPRPEEREDVEGHAYRRMIDGEPEPDSAYRRSLDSEDDVEGNAFRRSLDGDQDSEGASPAAVDDLDHDCDVEGHARMR